MAPQRTCGACKGSGETTTEFRDGRYESVLACEVCDGRGTVDAKASRADAVADAETLEQNIITGEKSNPGPVRRDLNDTLRIARQKGLGITRNGYVPGVAKEIASEAVHLVYAAIPGLR